MGEENIFITEKIAEEKCKFIASCGRQPEVVYIGQIEKEFLMDYGFNFNTKGSFKDKTFQDAEFFGMKLIEVNRLSYFALG